MSSIAATTSSPQQRTATALLSLAGATTSKTAAAATDQPATNVDLSDRAKALLAKAAADEEIAADLKLSFDERLAKRTDKLAQTLTDRFKKLNVNLDESVRLQVDKFGKVTTEGPWKEKIEKMFADDPELAKEFKTVAALNSLKAAQTALDLYTKEKGSAAGSKQQQKAWTDYNIRSINIQTLSGVMSLTDGKLRSAAVDYIDMVADPTGAAASSQKDATNRLA
uniref:Uncharacterized protein n=1 Tax=Rhodopseudomonas palustris (strain BisA53) TaxID=316055 RepID=Q07P41_RHOP5